MKFPKLAALFVLLPTVLLANMPGDSVQINAAISGAKTVFLVDRCEGCAKDTRQVFLDWKRYSFVPAPEKADLVFSFLAVSLMNNNGPEPVILHEEVRLVITDPKTQQILYHETIAKVQPWTKPAEQLAKELRKRVEKFDKSQKK